MRPPLSSYSKGTYAARFRSWRGALEAFVAWANEDGADHSVNGIEPAAPLGAELATPATTTELPVPPARLPRRTSREINLRLRFRVMQRDRFTCRACGRSPSSVPGLILHVDHRVAWSLGGETVMENLQTLCESCNLGKGSGPT